jgi:hypothetical protein
MTRPPPQRPHARLSSSAFLDEVDRDRKLPVAERERRAEYARKRYFAKLALASARARRAKKSTNATDGRPHQTAAVNTDPGGHSSDVCQSS